MTLSSLFGRHKLQIDRVQFQYNCMILPVADYKIGPSDDLSLAGVHNMRSPLFLIDNILVLLERQTILHRQSNLLLLGKTNTAIFVGPGRCFPDTEKVSIFLCQSIRMHLLLDSVCLLSYRQKVPQLLKRMTCVEDQNQVSDRLA